MFRSAYFWLCLPLVVCIALLPRYLLKARKSVFSPDDFDILRYIHKNYPKRDLILDSQLHGTLKAFVQTPSSKRTTPSNSVISLQPRQSLDLRTASRTDMSTGERSFHRGFDFSTEENGVAIRRMQTNLSERNQPRRKEGLSRILPVRRSFLRKKPPPQSQEESS